MKKILLDGEQINFSAQDLPLLIHGEDSKGSSLFSISVAADLYSQGAKLLFTSGFHMARDEFIDQVGKDLDYILIESEADIAVAHTKQIIFVPFEQSQLLQQLLTDLPDISQRVIFLKNYDMFASEVVEDVLKHKACVLQGDLNAATNIPVYLPVHWSTEIYFSQPPEAFSSQVPRLEKYSGFMVGRRRGIVKLDLF